MAWVWWLGGALLLGVAEVLSLDLVLLMFAGGALAGVGLSLLGVPLWGQIVGFAIVSSLLLFALRPWMLRHLRARVPLEETNAAAHVGRVAVVVDDVSERSGRVKLTGEVWTARTENDEELEIGAEVRVVRIAGATAIVTAYHENEVTPGVDPVEPGRTSGPRPSRGEGTTSQKESAQ